MLQKYLPKENMIFITLNKNATEELKQPYNKEQPNDSIKSNRKNNSY